MDILERWLATIEARDPARLPDLFAEDAVFISPVLHRPQVGRDKCVLYVAASMKGLEGEPFRYVAEYRSADGAVLEFVTRLGAIEINGVDMMTFDEKREKITAFKVMIRPAKAVDAMMVAMMQLLTDTSARTQARPAVSNAD